ncbi:MAG TPA: ATP-binding cassette domain-containing protein [Pseudonocardiaceae bacterium]
MRDVVLAVSGVERAFAPAGGGRPVPVLRGVDLVLTAGELVTLAGPSGSGKSALLAIVAGFDRPDTGTVTLGGAGGPRRPRWSTLALVPQSLGLLDELTCEENAAAPLLFRPGSTPADRRGALDRGAALLDRLGIGSLARRYPAEVSLGQQQRVALARALIARPTVLLADEPTAHLDHRTIDLVVQVLQEAVAEGTACLLATHDESLTTRAHRRLELHHGKLTDTGPGSVAA